jgi:hypothetical protein
LKCNVSGYKAAGLMTYQEICGDPGRLVNRRNLSIYFRNMLQKKGIIKIKDIRFSFN